MKKYRLIKEKLRKLKEYSFDFSKNESNVRISEISGLKEHDKDVHLLGMIVSKGKNSFFLQDPYASVELDLSECAPCYGLINAGFVTLVFGSMESVFKVKQLIIPKISSK